MLLLWPLQCIVSSNSYRLSLTALLSKLISATPTAVWTALPPSEHKKRMRNILVKEFPEAHSKKLVLSKTEHLWYSLRISKSKSCESQRACSLGKVCQKGPLLLLLQALCSCTAAHTTAHPHHLFSLWLLSKLRQGCRLLTEWRMVLSTTAVRELWFSRQD